MHIYLSDKDLLVQEWIPFFQLLFLFVVTEIGMGIRGAFYIYSAFLQSW